MQEVKTDANTETRTGLHLHGLDGLRAVAALSVIIGHVEEVKAKNGLSHFMNVPFIKNTGGHMGVILFFVISGFLITLLLLREQSATGRIGFRNFYIRRALRIWPLYFFVMIVSALLWQFKPDWVTIIFALVIMPNMGYTWKPNPVVWSIGVEEQFYLFWPAALTFFRRHLLAFLMAFAVGYVVLAHATVAFLETLEHPPEALIKSIKHFYRGARFDAMATGGLAAYFWHRGFRLPSDRWGISKALIIAAPFVCWTSGVLPPRGTETMYACLFALAIYQLTKLTKPSPVFSNPIINFLGRISYGLYMYHWMVAVLLITWLAGLAYPNDLVMHVTMYVLVIGVTVLISTISYYTFERYFLSLKSKFQIKRSSTQT